MTDTQNVVVLNNHRVETRDEASAWTPREALLDLLQQIDNGLEIEEMVICYDLGVKGSGFKNCTKSLRNATGLLVLTQMELYHQGAHYNDQ